MSLNPLNELSTQVGAIEQLETAVELGDGAAIAQCGAMLQESGVTCDLAVAASFADDFQHGVSVDCSAPSVDTGISV